MLMSNSRLRTKVIPNNIEIGNFICKIFRLDRDCRQKISKRSLLRNTQFCFHHMRRMTTKESLITFASNSRKPLTVYPSFEKNTGKLLFRTIQFFASLDSLNFRQALFNNFLLTCLNCKIGLSKSNFVFSRITILGYEVTGIASQLNITYISWNTRTNTNHFRDVTKMVFYSLF